MLRLDGKLRQLGHYLVVPGSATDGMLWQMPPGARRVKRVAKERLDLRRPFQYLSQRLLRNNSWVVVVPIIPSPALPINGMARGRLGSPAVSHGVAVSG